MVPGGVLAVSLLALVLAVAFGSWCARPGLAQTARPTLQHPFPALAEMFSLVEGCFALARHTAEEVMRHVACLLR